MCFIQMLFYWNIYHIHVDFGLHKRFYHLKKKRFYNFCVNSRFSEHHGQGILLDFGRSVEAHSINPLKQLRLSAMKGKKKSMEHWRLLSTSTLFCRSNLISVQILTDVALQMTLQNTKENWDLFEELRLGWLYSQDCFGWVYSVMTELPYPLHRKIKHEM